MKDTQLDLKRINRNEDGVLSDRTLSIHYSSSENGSPSRRDHRDIQDLESEGEQQNGGREQTNRTKNIVVSRIEQIKSEAGQGSGGGIVKN